MFRSNLFRSSTAILVALNAVTALAQYGGPQHYGGPQQWGGPAAQCYVPGAHGQAPILDYYNGNRPTGWDDAQPVEKLLGAVARRSWLRFEYMHWDFEGPGDKLLGAPLTDINDSTTTFEVFDNLSGGGTTGLARIPTLFNFGMDEAPGVRGTWGLDLNGGSMELSFFGTGEITDTLALTNLQAFRDVGTEAIGTDNRPNIVTPFATSGAPQESGIANFLVYDSSFNADLSAQMWGSEIMFLTNRYVPGDGSGWQWLAGFRYVNYDEDFNQVGVFNNGGTVSDRFSRISASTVNNIYGPEFGARASIQNRWMTLSATPRIAFALNDYTAHVISGPLVDPSEPAVRTTSEEIDFTPIVEVSLKAEIHVTPNFSVFGGFDMMWIYRMTRPYDNIFYDSEAAAAGGFTPQVGQRVDLESFYTNGFSLGGVFRY